MAGAFLKLWPQFWGRAEPIVESMASWSRIFRRFGKVWQFVCPVTLIICAERDQEGDAVPRMHAGLLTSRRTTLVTDEVS